MVSIAASKNIISKIKWPRFLLVAFAVLSSSMAICIDKFDSFGDQHSFLWALFSFISLSLVVLTPCFYVFFRSGKAYLPFIVYGVSIWVFLVAGVLAYNSRLGLYHPANLSYWGVIILASVPVYLAMLIPKALSATQKFETGEPNGNYSVKLLFVIAAIIASGVAIYCLQSGLPPLWKMILSGSMSDLSGALMYDIRNEATGADSFGNAKTIFLVMPSFLFLLSFYYFVNKKISIYLFSLILFVCVLLSSAFLHKKGLALYVPMMILVYVYVKGFSIRKTFYGMALLTASLILGFIFFYQGMTIDQVLDLLIFRVFGSYSFNTMFALNLFPEPQEYLWGKTMITFVGGGGENLPGLIMYQVYGVLGNASLSTFGHWYANFGWVGVVFVTSLITLWLFFLSYMHRYAKRVPFYSAIWLYFSVSSMDFATTEFFSAIGLKDGFITVSAILVYMFLLNFKRSPN